MRRNVQRRVHSHDSSFAGNSCLLYFAPLRCFCKILKLNASNLLKLFVLGSDAS